MTDLSVEAELIAVLVAVADGVPKVMTLDRGRLLPAGPLERRHPSLQAGLGERVSEQTGLRPGYLEQLYTFADRDRPGNGPDRQIISIAYLGLTRSEGGLGGHPGASAWADWYAYFPWEDHRQGPPPVLDLVAGRLAVWAGRAGSVALGEQRRRRVALAFGRDGLPWKDELVLQRYELLFEAGLVSEAGAGADGLGRPMTGDHRRILATGIARLRSKIRYRPVVFELLPPAFTLLQLQRTVEALAGVGLHKQNFRRLIETQELVEETGDSEVSGAGRPAKLFRFRHAVLEEHPDAGNKLPVRTPG
ncbi:NUDIX hydrolase [Oryzibacter oryziterrae]|uniref:NUDIX hydrolase n=1 Tax=Oryzibacter oryziterrae TaxID=2766474 RepID=UPI001F4564E4|nr:hypothetical protein [Oryzibacter oryziterrae]